MIDHTHALVMQHSLPIIHRLLPNDRPHPLTGYALVSSITSNWTHSLRICIHVYIASGVSHTHFVLCAQLCFNAQQHSIGQNGYHYTESTIVIL